MNMNSIFPIFIITIYIVIIYLIFLFKHMFNKKKVNYNIIKENPIITLYIYKLNNNKKLFYYTLFNLINNGYFKLYEEDNNIYIKKENKNTEDLYSFEKEVYIYINDIIYRDKGNDYCLLDSLEYNIKIDYSFLNSLGEFTSKLKSDVNSKIGKIDRISSLIIPFVIALFYNMQVILFITGKIDVNVIVFGSILLSCITSILSSKIKCTNNIYSNICFLGVLFINLLTAYITGQIWIAHSNYDYILFHLIMGLISFLYPTLLYLTSKYYNDEIVFMFNKKEKRIINKMNELLRSKKIKEEEQMLYRFYNKKYKYNNDLYNKFLNKFNI